MARNLPLTELVITGVPGSLLVLEESSDLSRWRSIGTNQLASAGSVSLLLPNAADHLFYRVVQP